MYYISIVKDNVINITYFYNTRSSGWTQDKKIATGFMNKKYAEILKTAIELNSKMNLEVINIPD